MRKVTLRVSLLAALFAFAIGCGGSREAAVITERPTPPPSTETPAPTQQAPATGTTVAGLTPMPAGYDTVRAQRFDTGKMWTFDNPPLEYFQQTYGFTPDQQWFEHARLGALRFATYCSASFVSPNGLVLTNHHCGRESVSEVSRPGENLLDNGFYATNLADERKVKDLFVDQLISITDVTKEIWGAVKDAKGDDARAEARDNMVRSVQERMTAEAKQRDTSLTVQVIEFYHGGQYSAYTFKRYSDVRLVMAPEVQLGFFGGDPDNFTYPRYALDMSMFRVYGTDGKPLKTDNYFKWSTTGTKEGDAVFVVGNPGSTSRLNTVAQLEYERDFDLPQQLEVMNNRAAILDRFIKSHKAVADSMDLENSYFEISNSIKANTGQLGGLRDPYLMARRAAAERDLMQAIAGTDSLRTQYGNLINEIRDLQRLKQASNAQAQAVLGFDNPSMESHLLVRGLYGYYFSLMKQRGIGTPEQLSNIRKEALGISNWPAELEREFITERFRTLQRTLPAGDPTLRRILNGKTPEQAAADLVATSALIDSARYAPLLDKGYLNSGDPSVAVIEAIAPLFFTTIQQAQETRAREDDLNARLALARFAIYGTRMPPDATFSLRIADGFVKGYTYNGTIAPAHTTFYGMYNDYYSYGGEDTPWELPKRWLNPPKTFDKSKQLNLVSTNDIIGGNSGSPLLNRNLELVGLVFDGNIESLPNNYLFRDEVARTVSVDSRGILEALDEIIDADRIVRELTTGNLSMTEAEADAAGTR